MTDSIAHVRALLRDEKFMPLDAPHIRAVLEAAEGNATSHKRIPQEQWEWFGRPGHLVVGEWCRFHLCTLIGEHLISTVGRYVPPHAGRSEVEEREWFAQHQNGETIGCDRTYETMVFRVNGSRCCDPECNCGMPDIIPLELDFEGYNNTGDATRGHMEMCRRWAMPLPAAAESEER